MIQFTYSANSESVSRALAALQAALGENAPALREIAEDFREMVAQQFASEGRAEQTPWPPRKLAGGAARARSARPRPADGPLLVRSGALRASLIGPSAPEHLEEADQRTLTLGSRLPYAMFHQTGTRRLPARPLLVLSDERARRWTGIVRGALEEKTRALGARELGG